MNPKSILIFCSGLVVPFVLGFGFLLAGGMPVATKGAPLPLERTIAGLAIHAAMRGEEGKTSPVPSDAANLLAGVKNYRKNCQVCHGGIESQPTAIAKGLFPKPPQLFAPDHGVTDDPIGEIFWKIKNGIRLTGMPGYSESLSDQEVWQVSQLLVTADKLPPEVQAELRAEVQTENPAR